MQGISFDILLSVVSTISLETFCQ